MKSVSRENANTFSGPAIDLPSHEQSVIHKNDTVGMTAQLVGAATQLFVRHGYEATSVCAITRAGDTHLRRLRVASSEQESGTRAGFATVLGRSVQYLVPHQWARPLRHRMNAEASRFRALVPCLERTACSASPKACSPPL